MRRAVSYISLFAAVLMTLSSCGGQGRVIPRGDMVRIYAEMFLLDEHIRAQKDLKRAADTSLVYAAVIDKYGYTVEDFKASQEKYLLDAGRYARMLKRSVDILEKEKTELVRQKRQMDALTHARELREIYAPNLSMLPDLYEPDTLDWKTHFDYDPQTGLDTVFSGPEVVIRLDTASVAKDTLTESNIERRADI